MVDHVKNNADEWDMDRNSDDDLYIPVKTGMVRMSLLFGSIAIAFALLLVPFITRETAQFSRSGSNLDYISTGSVSPDNLYIEHKSVLQKDGSSVCVLKNDGTKTGDC
jgi:hypothetical protein